MLRSRNLQLQFISIVFSFSILYSSYSRAITFNNLGEIQRALNTQALNQTPQNKRVKIAILDKGFWGYQNEIGRSLPSDTHYFTGPVETPSDLKVQHGLVMAQLVNEIARSPEIFLYNAFGYSNLKASINDLINQKVDLVLYSEVWEFGSNHDGRGFINALVNQAIDQGITWINAAGNFEKSFYTGSIRTLENDWIQLPDQNHSLKLDCSPIKGNTKCQIKIVLSWNEFKDDPEKGTDKDLDLALTDDFLNIIETSSLKQTSDPNEKRPGYTSYPRESITAEVQSGVYFIRVKNRSHNFDSYSELYISVDGDGIKVPSSSAGRSILNPADNPRVITVGAIDSDRSSKNNRLNKPNLLTMSSVKTSEGEFRGSSNSAAFVAAALALAKSRYPDYTIEQIIQRSTLPGWSANQRGLSLYWLGFGPPNAQCFPQASTEGLPQQIIDATNVGALYVQTNAGYRLMSPYDPILLNRNLFRYQANDFVLATPEGYRIAPRNGSYIPLGWVEVFQRPQEVGPCTTPQQEIGNIFRLNF